MPDDPNWLKLLERLGFNVTKIRWRLYQLERKRQAEHRVVPDSLRWLQYQHTICLHCGAIVPREDRQCPNCRRHVPGFFAYRFLRLLRTVFPKDSPIISGIFLGAILIVFAIAFIIQGPSALMSPSTETIVRLGGFFAARGLPWQESLARALTFALVHGGIIHLAFNATALYQVGPAVEAAIGHKRMFVLITATQLASAAATVFWYTMVKGGTSFTVGASGFLCGLVGFGIGYCQAQGPAGAPLRNFFLQWMGYVLVLGYFLGANNAAHVGGLIAGLPIGFTLQRRRRASRATEAAWTALSGLSALAWFASIAWLIYSASMAQ